MLIYSYHYPPTETAQKLNSAQNSVSAQTSYLQELH